MNETEPIEVFTGRTVHKVIEIHSKNQINNSLDSVYSKLDDLWQYNWHKNITPQESEEKYKNHARKCLENYYEKYGQKTYEEVQVEQKLFGKIAGETMTGIIDRLETGNHYAIIDYKTGEMPNEQYFQEDWQLALYALLIIQNTKINPNSINLQWEYIGLPKTISVTKTQKELDDLLNAIENKINTIKTAIKTDIFNKNVTERCQKCEYYQVSCDGKQSPKEQAITLNSWL